MKGYAGTGKSSITRIIVTAIKGRNKTNKVNGKVILTTFTHAAKGVLSRMARHRADTIHSLLKMGLDTSLENLNVGQRTKFLDPATKNIPMNSIILVDEASMISNALVDFILDAAKNEEF